MRKYRCIKDYHPLLRDKSARWFDGGDPVIAEKNRIWNESIKLVPSKNPVVKKDDIMVQMGVNDSRFRSQLNPDCALYEFILLEYKDCFEEIK